MFRSPDSLRARRRAQGNKVSSPKPKVQRQKEGVLEGLYWQFVAETELRGKI
jgi:hypothetical protein